MVEYKLMIYREDDLIFEQKFNVIMESEEVRYVHEMSEQELLNELVHFLRRARIVGSVSGLYDLYRAVLEERSQAIKKLEQTKIK